VALVTGGSRGIGAATCRALAANGVRVAVNGRDESAIEALVRDIAAEGGTAIGVPADVRHWEDIAAMRDQIQERLGAVDILAPFAGGFWAYTPTVDMSEAEWHEVIDANLTSTFLTVKAFVPAMIERRHGAIVAMASNAARSLDCTLTSSYAAAKAGIVQFIRHLAREVAEYGVRANTIAPGTTTTERIEANLTPDERQELAQLAPLGRLGTPEDSAYATLYLASDASAFLTGVTLDVSGGRVMV
jgi:NAD(P)-dependent dehydrogenase (short-subunit alcohol dehydrogenase family)